MAYDVKSDPFDPNGWNNEFLCSSPLRWYLNELLPFTEDYMYRPITEFEYFGKIYLVERVGPASICVLAVQDVAGVPIPLDDPEHIRNGITNRLEAKARENGYKWRPDPSQDLIFGLVESYDELERGLDR